MRCPIITGHTGNDGTRPNSIESVEKSIMLGADAFEVDVRKDENSELVLCDDRREPSNYASYIKLSEVLRLAARHDVIQINCDLKDEELALDVIALANDHGITSDRLILTGMIKPDYLAEHPDIVRKAIVYMNAENIIDDFLDGTLIDLYIGKLAQACLNLGVRGVNIPYVYLSDDNIKTFLKYGLSISAWTVNNESEMARLFKCGVENLITLNVEKAKSVRMNLLGF